jgi:hypothetical protein
VHPSSLHELYPLQHSGGSADAFVWVAKVLAAAAPTMTAPRRAKSPPLLRGRLAGAVVSLARTIECSLVRPIDCRATARRRHQRDSVGRLRG